MQNTVIKSTVMVCDLLTQAEQHLHAFDTARLDAELILCHVTGLERTTLYAHPELAIADDLVCAFKKAIDERMNGQPVSYLTGRKEFWSIDFAVNKHTLIPRPETECLVEMALAYIPLDKKFHIADLGTGCGNIGLAIAKERPACLVTATDISQTALKVAKINTTKLGLNNISFIKSDWFDGIERSFNLIISNPPYIKQEDAHLSRGDVKHEPRLALVAGSDGLQVIRQIIRLAPAYLVKNAWLLLEHGYDQGEKTRTLLNQYGFKNIQTHQDYSGLERISLGKKQ